MQLQQHDASLQEKNVAVVAVTFEAPERAAAYRREADLPWPLLVDQERKLYGKYGMTQGTAWQIFGPASWLRYAQLIARGRRVRRPTGDVHQLGGDVLIDPEGVVRLHHVGQGPADRPSIAEVLALISSASDK